MLANLTNDWGNLLKDEFKQQYFQDIIDKYETSVKFVDNVNLRVFPKKEDIFKAFQLTPFNDIKVVILGQDPFGSICRKSNIPYANGLAFSTQSGCTTVPKSLQNIFKELKTDKAWQSQADASFGGPDIENASNDLTKWAERGVLLLNTQLSVIEGNPNSHKFWNKFTDNVINLISEKKDNVIFIIWGNNSLKKSELIDKNKHHLLISSHPSPLSAYKSLKHYGSFFGSKVFSKTNDKLKEFGKEPINWNTGRPR